MKTTDNRLKRLEQENFELKRQVNVTFIPIRWLRKTQNQKKSWVS